MVHDALYPMLLNPALQVVVWGGRKLNTRLGKPLPSAQPYGEAWELHDSAVVSDGPLAGSTVAALIARYGAALLGAGHDPAQGMPLLIKFIDANEWLSVQVHPDDAHAAELEGQPRGKTEAWIVLDADPEAQLITGLIPGTTREALAEAVRADRLRDLLAFTPVHLGDALFMRAGTIHAIGPGLLVYEVQQSSSTTYRLYDWGRVGLDGKPRPLHIDKGLRVADPALRAEPTSAPSGPAVTVFDSPYFATVRHTLAGECVPVATGGCFQAISVVDGRFQIDSDAGAVAIERGRTALVPACIAAFTLSGTGIALRSWQPTPPL